MEKGQIYIKQLHTGKGQTKVRSRSFLIRKNSSILQDAFLNTSEMSCVFEREAEEDLHPVGRPSDDGPPNMWSGHAVSMGTFGTVKYRRVSIEWSIVEQTDLSKSGAGSSVELDNSMTL